MMRTRMILLAVAFLLTAAASAQDGKLKKLDRKKWKELVDEVNRKRYDKIEKEPEYNESPEREYNEFEREMYGEEREGSTSDHTITEDEGVYDASSTDDNDFFNEENDRTGENGNPYGEGEGTDVDPRYGDNENDGSGSQYEGSDRYNDRSESSDYQPYRDRSSPSSRATRSSEGGGGDSTWLIIVMIAVLAAAVIYMIIVSFSDKNKKVKHQVSTEEKLENLTITKSELELAIEAALANKNYREAVRIYFIAIIKEMKDRSWIKWEKKKTNYHYINEISGRAQQPDFITATRAFEIVWYGNRSLEESDYRQIEPHFKKLLTSINA